MKKLIKITVYSLVTAILLAGIWCPAPVMAEDPPINPDGTEWVPPEDGTWVPPEDGTWVPPEDGVIPPDGDGAFPPVGDGTVPPDGAGWTAGDGGWTPPDNFDPPDWWTPPDGWQPGEPLPEGTAPWEQIPGAETPDSPFTPAPPEFGDTPGIPDVTAPGGWASGDSGWVPPAEFNPPDWWIPPAEWEPGEPLPAGTAPWEQWTPGIDGWVGLHPSLPDDGFAPSDDGSAPPLPPTDFGSPDSTDRVPPADWTSPDGINGIPDGWMPNDDGSWTPPSAFDPPAWWTPPEGWELGEPLPEGTSPWEQLGLTPPNPGGFPGFDFPPGMEDLFGPGGPSIGDLNGTSLVPVPVPGSGFVPGSTPLAGMTGIPTTGNPEPLFDDEGNPVLDSDGDPVYGQPLLGSNGQPLTGNDGRPIYIVDDANAPIGLGMPDMGQPGGWSEGTNGGWMPPEGFNPPGWWIPPAGWEYGNELPAGTTPWEQIGLVDPDELEDIPPFIAPPGVTGTAPAIGNIGSVPPTVVVPARKPAPSGTVPLSTFGNFQFSPQVPLNDDDGDPILDSDGNPVYVKMVLDEDGNPVVGPFGKPITIIEE